MVLSSRLIPSKATGTAYRDSKIKYYEVLLLLYYICNYNENLEMETVDNVTKKYPRGTSTLRLFGV